MFDLIEYRIYCLYFLDFVGECHTQVLFSRKGLFLVSDKALVEMLTESLSVKMANGDRKRKRHVARHMTGTGVTHFVVDFKRLSAIVIFANCRDQHI